MASMAPSPASSCVSSDEEEAAAAKAMVVAGCPRCLMYVMLSSEPPRCPRCNSPVLLQFLHGADANTANANADANTNMHGGKS
ncbi:protein GL2-INTERACTING REPRESSOR 1-like [Triticum urartu]|uniref:protein GL2-INTERACTING REPRESSOR 1-like n=1 Tax=Triticum urartu TaxID=4572 RepID=UPI00162EAE53|nr:protein GL2-INTERACTING REPRESSOR 1-like [Triticum urartu]